MKRSLIAIAAAAALIGPLGQPAAAQVSNERLGNILGGVGGALLGSQIGGGSGRIVGGVVGAVGGAVVGGAIGRNVDEQNAAQQPPQQAARPVAPPPTLAPAAQNSFTALRNANIRRGPSTQTEIVGRLPQGGQVQGLGFAANGDWVLVDINGRDTGYIYAPLLRRDTDDYAG